MGKVFHSFTAMNGIDKIDPNVQYKNGEPSKPNDKVLGIRTIEQTPKGFELLKGHKEAFVLCDIENEVVLGQYIGNEYCIDTDVGIDERYKLFNGTEEEADVTMYAIGSSLKISETKTITVEIDAYSFYKDQMNEDPKDDKSFLLRINDGRIWKKNADGSLIINKNKTDEEKERINTRFVSVLCNGYPMILVQTTKEIKKNESLWADYGCFYQGALEEMHTINDQKSKMKTRKCILNSIDLKEDVPIDIDLINDAM